jgi:hypothetical protein
MNNYKARKITVLIIMLSLDLQMKFLNANNENLLRTEHGIAFENVGVVDNDMTTWFQIFVIPMTHTDFYYPK